MKNRTRFSKILLTVIIIMFFGCVPPARILVDVDLGMSKKQIRAQIGNPEGIGLSFKAPDGTMIEVWHYRLAQYEMATSMSPYFDIYGLFFENGELVKIEKLETNARLSERAALKMLGYPDVQIDVRNK